MTYEEKRRWLSRYGDAMVKAKHLRDDLDEAERDTGCTTQQLTGMPGGSGDGQSLARTVERIERAEKALNAQIMLCDDLHAELMARLEDVDDPKDYEVLRLKYLRFQDWEQIAQKRSICVRQVYRHHRKGVDALEL